MGDGARRRPGGGARRPRRRRHAGPIRHRGAPLHGLPDLHAQRPIGHGLPDVRRAGHVHARFGRRDRTADGARPGHGRTERRGRAARRRAGSGVPAHELPAGRRGGSRPGPDLSARRSAGRLRRGPFPAAVEPFHGARRPAHHRGAEDRRLSHTSRLPSGGARHRPAPPGVSALCPDGIRAVPGHPPGHRGQRFLRGAPEGRCGRATSAGGGGARLRPRRRGPQRVGPLRQSAASEPDRPRGACVSPVPPRLQEFAWAPRAPRAGDAER